jgi:hypothetical protein
VKQSIVASLIVAASFLAACSDSTGTGTNRVSTSVSDANGDTFGTGVVKWDITSFTVTRDTNGVGVALDFTGNPHSSATGTNETIGFVEFDTDQDSTTGVGSITSVFDTLAGTGIGVEFEFVIDTAVDVIDAVNNVQVGTVHATFSGHRLSFSVPRAMLGGDDGFLNAVTIIGTPAEPTDVAPNTGTLRLNPPIPAAPYMPAAGTSRARLPAPRVWGSWR